MSKKPIKPNWVLSEEWGLGYDPLNWKLYKRTRDKDGEPTGWKNYKYFGTLKHLATELTELTMRLANEGEGIDEHMNLAVKACSEALSALETALDHIKITMGEATVTGTYKRLQ